MLRRAARTEGRALRRLALAAQHEARNALTRLVTSDAQSTEPVLGIEVRIALSEAEAALGDVANASPATRYHAEHLAHHGLRLAIAVAADRAAVLVLDLASPSLELTHTEIDAFEDVDRLEPRHHDGHLVLSGDGLVLLAAHDGADVTGGEEAADAVAGRRQDRAHRRRHQHMRYQHREVPDALPLRLIGRHGVGGRRGLEADREEHDLPVGLGPRNGERVERRIDDPDVAAARLGGEQITARTGDAQHVAERAEGHLGPRRDLDRLVDVIDRGDADGTA